MYDNNDTYHSLDQLFNAFGLTLFQEIVYFCLIPISIIGIMLNILALCILDSHKFTLPFYTYLRAYTVCSIFICLFNSSHFSVGLRRTFEFTNSRLSMIYICYFYIPIITILNVYGTALDVILSIERIVLLSTKMNWYKYMNARRMCILLAVVFSVLTTPYWFFFEPNEVTVYLNGTTLFVLHFYKTRKLDELIKFYFYIFRFFADVIPIFVETTANIFSVYLIKKYIKKRKRMVSRRKTEEEMVLTNLSPKKFSIGEKSKKVEIKITILVIFLSIVSIM
jgi:hypothetical protein